MRNSKPHTFFSKLTPIPVLQYIPRSVIWSSFHYRFSKVEGYTQLYVTVFVRLMMISTDIERPKEENRTRGSNYCNLPSVVMHMDV